MADSPSSFVTKNAATPPVQISLGTMTDAGIQYPQHVLRANSTPVSDAAPLPVKDATTETALGAPADAAWSGTGTASVIAALKALWTAITGNLLVRSAGSVGTDASANAPTLPGGYVLLTTITANANRNYLIVQNQSASVLQVIVDDGAGGSPTILLIDPSQIATNRQGGAIEMTAERGRVRVYGPTGSQLAARTN